MSMVKKSGEFPRVDFGQTAFLLDVDGTLLDIAPVPGAVHVPHNLPHCLDALRMRTLGAVSFVSGRTLRQIDELFAPFIFAAIGSHGGEIRFRKDLVFREPPLPDDVKQRFMDLAALDPRILFEDKGCSLAFHYRLVPEIRPVLFRALEERKGELHEFGLEVLRGKAIVEIKPRRFNKATALRKLMQESPFAQRIPLFAGDDRTDEDVFAILPGLHGIGISVGQRMAGAGYMICRPEEMRHWLCSLASEQAP